MTLPEGEGMTLMTAPEILALLKSRGFRTIAAALESELDSKEKRIAELERPTNEPGLLEINGLLSDRIAALISEKREAEALLEAKREKVEELAHKLRIKELDCEGTHNAAKYWKIRHAELDKLSARREDSLTDKTAELEAENANLRALYDDLLFQVSSKYPDETRHQTAVRLIHWAQNYDSDLKTHRLQEQSDG